MADRLCLNHGARLGTQAGAVCSRKAPNPNPVQSQAREPLRSRFALPHLLGKICKFDKTCISELGGLGTCLWVVSINQLEGVDEALEDASLFHDTQHLPS